MQYFHSSLLYLQHQYYPPHPVAELDGLIVTHTDDEVAHGLHINCLDAAVIRDGVIDPEGEARNYGAARAGMTAHDACFY